MHGHLIRLDFVFGQFLARSDFMRFGVRVVVAFGRHGKRHENSVLVCDAHGFVRGLVAGVHSLAEGAYGVLRAIFGGHQIKLGMHRHYEQRAAFG